MTRRPRPSRDDAVGALLQQSGRTGQHVGLRRAFVQRGKAGHSRPGVLCELVRRHDDRALDLYLLLKAKASGGEWNVHLPAAVWARCLGLDETRGRAAVSKAWQRLERHELVVRARSGRMADVRLLHEEADGTVYEPPAGTRRDPYFKIPFAYWLSPDRYYRTLDLPAKAMLLVALSLKDDAELPLVRVPDWYGLSEDTAGRGLKELERRGLVSVRVAYTPAPLTVTGYHEHRHIRVDSEFRNGGLL